MQVDIALGPAQLLHPAATAERERTGEGLFRLVSAAYELLPQVHRSGAVQPLPTSDQVVDGGRLQVRVDAQGHNHHLSTGSRLQTRLADHLKAAQRRQKVLALRRILRKECNRRPDVNTSHLHLEQYPPSANVLDPIAHGRAPFSG